MTTSLMPEARQKYYANDGVTPLAGGLLYTYAAGTATNKATYTDSAGLVPHANPIALDAKGEAVIYWDGAYKVDLKTAAGVQITGYPVDNYTPPTDTLRTALTASTGSSLVGHIASGSGATARTVQAKLRDLKSAKDFGAAGDGVTNDDAAFSDLEGVVSGQDVNLLGLTYLVTTIPTQNRYTNGVFRIEKSTTINGAADIYDWYAGAARPEQIPSSINILRDASAGLANRNYLLTQVLGFQGFAFDEKAAKIYTLHVDGDPEVSYISEYAMAGGTSARSATGVSNSSAQLGHQGIAVEYLADGTNKLWGSVRYHATNFPEGGRQAIRFNYAGSAADITNIETYTLFGPEFAYTTNNTMPTVSYCGRFLVAVGRKTSRDFWVRVFDMAALVAGGAGDYSDQWLFQFNVDRDVLSDDTGAEFRPVQGIACDGASIYIISGNSRLTGKRLDRYSLSGRLEQSNNSFSVGITEATADGTFYEPEGLAIYRPNNTAPPSLVVCIVSAAGGAHINRLWVMGYQATITEERGTLVAGRWTPTATLGTNVAAATPGSAHYTRVGNTVNFSGRITIDPTATGFCTLELSLPIASNFSSITDAAGVFNALGVSGAATTVDTGGIEGSVANKTLVLSFIAGDTANRAYYYTGSYEVK